jgi:hypothetical protein
MTLLEGQGASVVLGNMREPEEYKIELDLDRDRIRTVLSESYEICKSFLCVNFEIERDQFVSRIDPFLASNRVSIPIQLNLPCRNFPGMKIEIDLRRRKSKVWMFPKNKQAILNHMLKAL